MMDSHNDDDKKKLELLYEIDELKRRGIKWNGRALTFEDSLDELTFCYELLSHKEQMRKEVECFSSIVFCVDKAFEKIIPRKQQFLSKEELEFKDDMTKYFQDLLESDIDRPSKEYTLVNDLKRSIRYEPKLGQQFIHLAVETLFSLKDYKK